MKPITPDNWHVPLSRERIKLRTALDSLGRIGNQQSDIPFMVQLVENPRYDIPGFDLFHGAVDIKTHDCIHILLGRGLLPKDEAFAIGFTMGSTNKVGTLEETLYALISKYFYPKVYRFNDEAIRIFRDAVRLGYISDCLPLNRVKFDDYLDWPLGKIRREVGLETELLLAYYRIEQRRFPQSKASRRLLK